MSALALFGAYGTLLVAGYGLLALLVRQKTSFSVTEQFAFSWLLGTGAVSLLLWIFGLFVRGTLLPGLVSIVCLSLGLAGWRQRVPLPVRRTPKPFEIFLGIIIVIEIAIVFYLSFVHTLGWDGLLNWEIKARYAFANGGVLPATYFSDSGRAFSHPEYPLAIPFTELWLYLWLGQADQFFAKTIFPIFYVVGTFLLVALGQRLAEEDGLDCFWRRFYFLSHKSPLKSEVRSLVTRIFLSVSFILHQSGAFPASLNKIMPPSFAFTLHAWPCCHG